MFPAGHMPVGAAVQFLIPGPWGYAAALASHLVVDGVGEAGYKNFKVMMVAQIFWFLVLATILCVTKQPYLAIGAILGELPDIFLILAKLKIINYEKGIKWHKAIHKLALQPLIPLTPKIQVVVHFAFHFVLFGLLVK